MNVLDIAEKTVKKAVESGAAQAEASVFEADSALTRYTKNIIHQNVASTTYYLNLELVMKGKKLGSSAVNNLEASSIDAAIERALKIAKVSSPDPEFESLVEPKTIKPIPKLYCKKTADVTPEDRALAVKTVIDTAMGYDKKVKWSAGSYTTETIKYALVNSLGVDTETKYTSAVIEAHTRAGEDAKEGSGFTVSNDRDVSKFDFEKLAKSAAKDAVNSIGPKLLDIGEYEAIFTPEAVSTFTRFIAMLGISAKAYQEGYSFVTDKIGSQVFDEKLTIVDDGRSLDTSNAAPFDGEGTPKQRLSLVNKGVVENLCYDNYTARKDKTESTGHALPKFSRGFYYRGVPLPVNQIVEPGDSTVDEMIEDTKKGVYISRLHYVNPIRRDKAVISGLTRDACWYIEGGEIKYPIKVMRFTDAVPKVLGEIDLIGGKKTVAKMGMVTTPPIRVGSFRFTGQSQF
ncbi:TldD/PmbA family protein [Candidatus Bathyarchaeota archaeon]|nr:TldD/PmbA family protein [Candidatus Bathyarchaeota archaeon]